MIIRVAEKQLPNSLADRRIRVVIGDGRRYVQTNREPYDVIIAGEPEPATSQANRYYTLEFFREVRRALKDHGVLCFALGRLETYISREQARMLATAGATARSVFRNLLVLPPGRIVLLCSDGDLTADIAGRIEKAGIQTRFIRRGFLEASLSPDRLADVARAASQNVQANTDFDPVLYFHHLRHWMSRFHTTFGLAEVAIIAGILVYVLRLRAVPFTIFTTGLAGSALQVVVLLAFQIVYGSLYHQLALLVTMFMIGLAIGSFWAARVRQSRRGLLLVELAMIVCAGATPLALLAISGANGPVASALSRQLIFPLLALLPGLLVGIQFPLAANAEYQTAASTASRLYAADLIGAALGAILVSALDPDPRRDQCMPRGRGDEGAERGESMAGD